MALLTTYLDLESLKIRRSGFNSESNLTSAIGDLANRDILASYVSCLNAMAYNSLLPHLLNNDATIFVFVVVGPCRQDGGGGKKRPLPPMPLLLPTRGGTLRKSKSSTAAAPTATSTLTGPRMMD